MKDTRRRMEVYPFYHHTGIEAHLEKMAEKGWMLERISNRGWHYRRIEPKKLHFCISYYPKASEFDPEPSEEQKTFLEFCAHTGWTLVCTTAQMQIFCNERENPVPIETDPVLEVENIHASMKKSFLKAQFFLMALGLVMSFFFVGELFVNVIDVLARPTKLFTGVCWLLVILLSVTDVTAYFRWHKKAVVAAEQGIFLDTPSTLAVQWIALAVLGGCGIFLLANLAGSGDTMMLFIFGGMGVYMFLLFLFADWIKRFGKKLKWSRGANMVASVLLTMVASIVMMNVVVFATLKLKEAGVFDPEQETYRHGGMTWTVHNDEIPLRIGDLMGEEHEGYSTEKNGEGSLFLSEYTMRQDARFDAEDYEDMYTLQYTVVDVKMPFLYDLCRKERMDDLDETDNSRIPEGHKNVLVEADPAPWGAVEAYNITNQSHMMETSHFLLCYANRLIEIRFTWDVTDAQKAVVGEKLG